MLLELNEETLVGSKIVPMVCSHCGKTFGSASVWFDGCEKFRMLKSIKNSDSCSPMVARFYCSEECAKEGPSNDQRTA